MSYFRKKLTGDRELDDMIMAVQNQIAATKLTHGFPNKKDSLETVLMSLAQASFISGEMGRRPHIYNITFGTIIPIKAL